MTGSLAVRWAIAWPFAVCTLALLPAAGANAGFTVPELVSGTQRIQFNEADAPATSADGDYIVFQGSLAGVPGVYRRDVQTGTVEEVAGGDPADPREPCNAEKHPLAACDAAAPSVSADGRYIAFTTTADLQPEGAGGRPAGEPGQDRNCPEVYVRDMGPAGESLSMGAPGAYTLASALNESSQGIAFPSCAPEGEHHFAVAGAQAAPAVALSEDGRHVVFTVLSVSNLTRGPGCPALTPLAECPLETPPSQVAVRDLDTRTTTLVTTTPSGNATPGGGAFPSSESEASMRQATAESDSSVGDQITGSTAAISADASTVAWLGTNVPEQVSGAGDVAERGLHTANQSPLPFEAEPLWRRVADGGGAVTQRLLAGAGRDFYMNVGQERAIVYDGSFAAVESPLFVPPVLSRDGHTVALIANAPTPAGAEEFAFYKNGAGAPPSDGYVVNVADGPASTPQVTALTAIPSYLASQGATASIVDIAISPDGSRVAFDTARTQFALPALAFVSPPSQYTNVRETYEANLALGTLQRVTSTYSGATPNGNAGLLAFSGDGQTLAFASQATNLFYGDSIPTSQVYVVREQPSLATPAPQEVSAPPELSPPALEWKLSATATAQADGSVLLDVQVPGAGRMTVDAAAQLPALARRRATVPRTARPQAGRGGRARAAKSAGTVGTGKRASLLTRTVARGGMASAGPAQVQLRLRVSAPYRALVASRLGLYAVLRVSFAAADHSVLTQEIPVTFHELHLRATRGTRTKAGRARRKVKA